MTNAELREQVARAHYNAEIRQPGERTWESLRPGIQEAFRQTADQYIALALEEAARVAETFPAKTHGHPATAPYAAAEQAADEIAAAIRALIPSESSNE